MKVVILGGTGVLSSAISRECIKSGYNLIHFNRHTKTGGTNVKTIVGNRYNESDLKKILQFQPDVVIDMLCFNKEHADLAAQVFKGNVNQYIFCSTSCVYTPNNKQQILTESSETNPFSEYGNNKLEAEKVFKNANKKNYFNVTIFRPGHVFSDDFTVSNLSLDGFYTINRIKRGLDVILTEGGNRFWQACYSDNIGLAFAKSCGNSACYGNVYNIAGEENFTWNELYTQIISKLNSSTKIKYLQTDSVVNAEKKKFDFLDSVTRYDWLHDTSRLKHDVPDYNYNVNFNTGIVKVLEKHKADILEFSPEESLYEKLLSNF